MNKCTTSFIPLVLTLFIASSVKSQGYNCQNPLGELGFCVNIRECQPLLSLLRTHGNAVGEFLRSSVCGFDNHDPKVCCPADENTSNNNNQNPNPATHSQPPTVRPSPKPFPRASEYGPLFPPDCGVVTNGSYTRVVGGNPAALGNWPWMAALGYRSSKKPNRPLWLCGGSLISSRHVLTAGHCVHRRNDLYIVRLGDLDLDDSVDDGATPVDILINNAIIHPEYSSVHFTNDIAVLKLDKDVQFTWLIKPICLPLLSGIINKNLVHTIPFIAGWGSIYFRGPSSSHLQQLQVPVIELETCQNAFKRFKTTIIDDRVLCAGYYNEAKDACQGDSGGPLMSTWADKEGSYKGRAFYIVGIISYGYRCAEPGIPGVYTKVAEFVDFIRSNLN